jgi:phosphoglycolate phosphatase-like HAD superfamily hydrolase
MIKNIIFDFDGVICESVHIKTEAFYEMYLPYGEDIAQKVKAHHLANGGMSRFDKFAYYEKTLLGQDLSPERKEVLSTTFSTLVKEKVITAPFVPGALEFLQKSAKNYRCFIVSATPMDEMIEIAKAKGIDQFFEEICGSPKDKIKWGRYLVETYSLHPKETLFIGDAKNDYIAAKENGFHFLWRQVDEATGIPKETLHTDDLTNLQTLLTEYPTFHKRT